MVIMHNMAAGNANRQLGAVSGSLAGSAEKLSSGYRINRAADDAAGLKISEKMRRQIRGLGRASKNCQDGVSMCQTAEGALNEVHEMLKRMNELAVQSANGTNSQLDRAAIQAETDQLKTEIDRIAETTKFNEMYLLDGSLATDTEELGELYADYARRNSGSYQELGGGSVLSLESVRRLDGLKIVYNEVTYGVVTKPAEGITPEAPTGAAALGIDPADLSSLTTKLQEEIVPHAVKGILDAYSGTFGYLKDSTISIGIDFTNDGQSTTLATMSMSASTAGVLGYTLSVNLATLLMPGANPGDPQKIDLSSDPNDGADSRDRLEATIVHEMMHCFCDEALTNGMSGYNPDRGEFDKKERFPGWFIEGLAQTACGGCFDGNDWVNGYISPGDSPDKIAQVIKGQTLAADTMESRYSTGYLATMYLGYLAAGKPGALTEANMQAGVDQVLSDLKDGKSLQQVVKNYAGATLEDFEKKFGADDAESQEFIKKLVDTVGGPDTTGGLATGFDAVNKEILSDSDAHKNLKLFKIDPGTKMYYNDYSGDPSWKVFTGGTTYNGEEAPAYDASNLLEVEFPREAGRAVRLQVGADTENGMLLSIGGISTELIGVKNVDLSEEMKATASLHLIGFGMERVSAIRSKIGAYQNRLEHAIASLDNTVENTTASESRIRDTDMAEEMVRYSKSSILAQAGQSMLAQANQSTQGVLSLLG